MTPFSRCYIVKTASFLPGDPVDNDGMDKYVGSINPASGRIKKRVLRENGIQRRHYAIDASGKTLHSVVDMGGRVVDALLNGGARPDFLAAATTGGDCAAPGLANHIQGHLHLPPMETVSINGICAASIGALNAAAQAIESGSAKLAFAVASEIPSRLFKASRFAARSADVDFDAHFLRWMLSDGAGGVALASAPASHGLSLKLKWIHQKSFSGDLPTCMQVGLSHGGEPRGYLDYPTLDDAEKAGAFDLRQDIRLLPNLFDLGLHEYACLAKEGHLDPSSVSWFLCHYSSERFRPVIAGLMEEAGLSIPFEKWFSNLATRGNTGSASIFIMLDEFMASKVNELKVGDTVFGFVPESGRFSVAYFLAEVVGPGAEPARAQIGELAPADPVGEAAPVAALLQDLMGVWHDYRSAVFRTPLARSVLDGSIRRENYLAWMENWIPQVREGSLWMRRAVSSMGPRYRGLADLVQLHANDEHRDWQVLYDDYRTAGGMIPASSLVRNPGGEALNAFMNAYASQPDPVGLLGGIYIIEGTGQRIVPTLLPKLRQALGVSSGALRFVEYHGENDQHHMQRWLQAIRIVADEDERAINEIARVARTVATLYLQQWDYVALQEVA